MYSYSTNLSTWKPSIPPGDIQFDYMSKSSTSLGTLFCNVKTRLKVAAMNIPRESLAHGIDVSKP